MNTSMINRRRHERFRLPAAYTSIAVRRLDDAWMLPTESTHHFEGGSELDVHDDVVRGDLFRLHGHAYDLSEGGVQFELDHPIAPGTPIALRVDLPPHSMQRAGDVGPGRAVFVMGNVVWMDDSEPGPVRMAMAITRFAREGDRERLIRCFATGVLRRAA